MRFDGMLQRAKDRGVKLLLVQLNPTPRFQATVKDTEISKSLGAAMAIVAQKFSENSKGKYTPEMVLVKLLEDVQIHAKTLLPTLGEQTDQDKLLRNYAAAMTKRLKDSGELDDLLDSDDEEVPPKPTIVK